MFTALRKLARRARSAMLVGRPVLARKDIVRRGQYVPRGATGRIVSVRADGDLDIAFDRIETENLSVQPREVAPAPALTPRAFLGLRIFSH